MLIVYTSLTGNVKRFSQKLNNRSAEWHSTLTVGEPFVFITYTISFGKVPKGIMEWLEDNKSNLKGILCSGNKNWGKNYGAAGRILSDSLAVPLLHTFELSGTDLDVAIVNRLLNDQLRKD